MINSLQSLRGIFAIFIFLHHIQYNGENLFLAGGPCGVTFFFILSGFVMCAGWEKKIDEGRETKTQLFLRRIIRVYPLHLLCLFAVILLSFRNFNINFFIKLIPNLFLLQSWIPIQSVYFSGNALSWCLCDLMFFYLVFPFFMTFIERQKKVFFRCIILVTLIYLYVISLIPEEHRHAFIYINPIFRLLDFLIGITLWQIWLTIRSKKHHALEYSYNEKIFANLLEVGSFAVLVITLVFSRYIPQVYWFDAYWWIPASILILIFTFFNKSGGGIGYIIK